MAEGCLLRMLKKLDPKPWTLQYCLLRDIGFLRISARLRRQGFASLGFRLGHSHNADMGLGALGLGLSV